MGLGAPAGEWNRTPSEHSQAPCPHAGPPCRWMPPGLCDSVGLKRTSSGPPQFEVQSHHFLLCDLGQIPNLPVPQFPHV